MRYDIGKMTEALDNIESLIADVAAGYFIPKKFRKAPFTDDLRAKYLAYLEREVDKLITQIEATRPKRRKIEPVLANAFEV